MVIMPGASIAASGGIPARGTLGLFTRRLKIVRALSCADIQLYAFANNLCDRAPLLDRQHPNSSQLGGGELDLGPLHAIMLAHHDVCCFSERLGRADAVGGERHLHLLERRLVDLRNAAFVDAQDAADFLHGHFAGVV